MSMNVRQTTHVMSMQTVMILMAATGVSAGQDSWEMDTTAQVYEYEYVYIHFYTKCNAKHYGASVSESHLSHGYRTAVASWLHQR